MPLIATLNSILVYIYGFDHVPPHLHIHYAEYWFLIEIESRKVEGDAPSKVIKAVNEFIDQHKDELMDRWEKASRGEKVDKIL